MKFVRISVPTVMLAVTVAPGVNARQVSTPTTPRALSVTSTADDGGAGTLRWAIETSNATPERETIAIATGRGHTNSGRYAKSGFNPLEILPAAEDRAGGIAFVSTKANVTKAGGYAHIVTTEGSARQHGRGIAPSRAYSAVASEMNVQSKNGSMAYTIDGDLYRTQDPVAISLGPPIVFLKPPSALIVRPRGDTMGGQ